MATVRYLRRRDYSDSDTESVEGTETELSLSREVYQQLGDLQSNKTLVRPEIVDSIFDKFIVKMDDYAKGVSTPSTAFQELDIYLGKLGLTEEYPFNQDTYYSEPWLDPISQSPTRNVAILNSNGTSTDNIVVGSDNVVYLTGV